MSPKQVLVIEDEFQVGLDLQCLLSGAGFEVVGPMMTLDEALHAAEQAGLQCAVVDANLNGHSAGPVAEKLQERGIPFVVVTGYERPFLPLSFSAAPRIAKPVQASSLLAIVRQLCSEFKPIAAFPSAKPLP